MANNPRAFDPRVREARQNAYLAVPTLAELLPDVEEVSFDLRFVLTSGKPHSSPHRWIFVPDMQAYFNLMCPERDCSGGGFDLAAAVQAAARAKGHEAAGTLTCGGKKGREPCGLALHYTVDVRQRDS